jgi:RNAse (barnase) inhibitor barstar
MPQIFTIDGRDFSTLEEFYEAVGAVLVPGQVWGKNLDAFNDILCWPIQDKEPYILVWKNSKLSRKRLNHLEAERQLERRLTGCHPSNRSSVAMELERASRCERSGCRRSSPSRKRNTQTHCSPRFEGKERPTDDGKDENVWGKAK